MTPTQQELYTHIKKHSDLRYSELFEDIGQGRGLNILDTRAEVQELIKQGLVIEHESSREHATVRAA
jgi:hypothetical protein